MYRSDVKSAARSLTVIVSPPVIISQNRRASRSCGAAIVPPAQVFRVVNAVRKFGELAASSGMHASTLAKYLESEGQLLAARNPASSQHSNLFIATLTVDVRPYTAQATGHKRRSIQLSGLSANGTSTCLRICTASINKENLNINTNHSQSGEWQCRWRPSRAQTQRT